MKKALSIFLCATTFGLSAASAQTVQSAFFLDNYAYSYRLNPSIMNEKSFFAIGLGSLSAELGSDLGLSSFVYPNQSGDGLVSAFHPSISTKEFTDNLKEKSNFDFNLNYNLLSFGSRKENKMFNFEVNVRNDLSLNMPVGLFKFMKSGSSETAYDFSGFGLTDNAVIEVAFGGAKTKDKFTIGWRAKVLVGAASANVSLSTANLTVNGSKVAVDAVSDARIATNPNIIKPGASGEMSFNSLDPAALRPSGYGGAIDLGVTWKPVPYVTITAGVTDLGIMSWQYGVRGNSSGKFDFSGLQDVDFSGAAENIGEEFGKLGQDLLGIANLTFEEGSFSEWTVTPIKLNAGVRARLPFTRILSLGALATYDIKHNFFEARLGGTLTPLPFISATANVGASSIGTVCGGALSINLLGINFFTGIDAYMGRITQIPLSFFSEDVTSDVTLPAPVDPFRYRVTMGITLQLFGKRIKG